MPVCLDRVLCAAAGRCGDHHHFSLLAAKRCLHTLIEAMQRPFKPAKGNSLIDAQCYTGLNTFTELKILCQRTAGERGFYPSRSDAFRLGLLPGAGRNVTMRMLV